MRGGAEVVSIEAECLEQITRGELGGKCEGQAQLRRKLGTVAARTQ